MSEFKGTPGPWKAVKAAHGPIDIFDQRGRDVVTFYGGGVEAESQSANAKLIAAAPELMGDGQFLLDRLADFERELEDDGVAREFYGHVSPAIARLSAAVAKALGEEK